METVNLEPTISSISQLQGTCNTIENRINQKLVKLEAVTDIAGKKATEASFNGRSSDIGQRKITAGGGHSAFIDNENTTVTIT